MPAGLPPPFDPETESSDAPAPAFLSYGRSSGDPPPNADPSPGPNGETTPARVQRRLTPLIVFFVALAVVGYFVFTAVDGVINNNSLDLQIAALQEEIADLQWDADQLSALVAYLDSDEYIERTAREDLGFVRVGEEAFAIDAPLRVGLPITRSPWWTNLLPQPAPEPDAGS